jgi:hypothetical protein
MFCKHILVSRQHLLYNRRWRHNKDSVFRLLHYSHCLDIIAFVPFGHLFKGDGHRCHVVRFDPVQVNLLTIFLEFKGLELPMTHHGIVCLEPVIAKNCIICC